MMWAPIYLPEQVFLVHAGVRRQRRFLLRGRLLLNRDLDLQTQVVISKIKVLSIQGTSNKSDALNWFGSREVHGLTQKLGFELADFLHLRHDGVGGLYNVRTQKENFGPQE